MAADELAYPVDASHINDHLVRTVMSPPNAEGEKQFRPQVGAPMGHTFWTGHLHERLQGTAQPVQI